MSLVMNRGLADKRYTLPLVSGIYTTCRVVLRIYIDTFSLPHWNNFTANGDMVNWITFNLLRAAETFSFVRCASITSSSKSTPCYTFSVHCHPRYIPFHFAAYGRIIL